MSNSTSYSYDGQAHPSEQNHFSSGSIFLGQVLRAASAPSVVTRTLLLCFDLPQKLAGRRRFAPESLIAGFAAQALVHVAQTHLKGTPEDGHQSRLQQLGSRMDDVPLADSGVVAGAPDDVGSCTGAWICADWAAPDASLDGASGESYGSSTIRARAVVRV